jgi:coenzyme Q-binding protein COQ10
VYCVPGQVVEAVSGGSAETSIPRETLLAVGYSEADLDLDKRVMEGGIFESLVTRWTVKPVVRQGNNVGGRAEGDEWTEVTLSVTFRFANPALGLAVGQVADDKVDEMVEAFEGRARELYGRR